MRAAVRMAAWQRLVPVIGAGIAVGMVLGALAAGAGGLTGVLVFRFTRWLDAPARDAITCAVHIDRDGIASPSLSALPGRSGAAFRCKAKIYPLGDLL